MFLIKTRLLDTAFHQHFPSDRGQSENLTPSEFKAKKHLTKKHLHSGSR